MSTPHSQTSATSKTEEQQTPDNVVQLGDRLTTTVDTKPDVLTFFSGGNRYRLDRETGVIAKTSKNRETGETTKRAVLPFVPDVMDVTVDLDEDDLQDRKLYTITVDGEESRVTHRQLLTGDVWANFSVSGHGSRGMVNVLADAVLRLAEDHPPIPLHRHTGWAEQDGRPVYLTAEACIGADGAVPGPAIELGHGIGKYALPAPPTGDAESDAVRASLGLLDLAPAEVMWPLLLMTYLPPLELCADRPDFLGVINGPSDSCKSVLAGLALSHFSPRRPLAPFPEGFGSTRTALEVYLHGAKNVLQVIDDYHPPSNSREKAAMDETLQYLARASANGSARGRGSRNGGLRKTRPPRGLALVTAENNFKVASAENRSFIIRLQQHDVDRSKLDQASRNAETGVYAQAMAGFIRYLAQRHEGGELAEIRDRWSQLHSELVASGRGRSAGHLAHLLLAAKVLADYAWYIGAIDADEADRLEQSAHTALLAVDTAASVGRDEIDPVTRWVELLREAFDSKQAHIESMDGSAPEDAANWGWEQVGGFGGGDQVRRGLMIGNLSEDGRTLYLVPKATHALLDKVAGADGIGMDERAMNDRLGTAGVIQSRTSGDKVRHTHPVRIGQQLSRRLWVLTSAMTHDTEGSVTSPGPCVTSPETDRGNTFQSPDQQEHRPLPLLPLLPRKNHPPQKTGGAFIADRVATALEQAGGDRAAATKALVAKAIPDTMELFDATRAGARYDHTAHPAEPDILRKPAKGAANAVWEARPKWTNPATAAGTEIQPLDVNAAYMGAMTTHLPIGTLQHDDSGVFDRKRSGVYEITPGSWDHDQLPNPLGSRDMPGRVWVTRPTLQLLTDLSTDRYGTLCPAPVVHQSWTSGSSEALLRPLKETLRDARAEAIESGDEVALDYIKAMYSKFVSTMAKSSRYNHDLERTDWGHIIRAQAHANLWRRAHKAHTAGLWVHRLTGVDELHVAGDWRKVWDEGRGLGQMKPKGDTYRAGEQ